MPISVTKYQTTPNPNALRCALSGVLSDRPQSFRKAHDAEGNPVAMAFFAVPGVTSLLIGGDWMTVNKSPESDWPSVKRGIEHVLTGLP